MNIKRRIILLVALALSLTLLVWMTYRTVNLTLTYEEPEFQDLVESTSSITGIYCRSKVRSVLGALHLELADGAALVVYHKDDCSKYEDIKVTNDVRYYWSSSFGRHWPFELYVEDDRLLEYYEEAQKIFQMRKGTIRIGYIILFVLFGMTAVLIFKLTSKKRGSRTPRPDQ